MAARILLVGIASDGPPDAYLVARNQADATTALGGSYIERFTLSPSATGCELAYEPLEGITNSVDGTKSVLYRPRVSNKSLSFGALGGSEDRVVDVAYTPYLGKSDVLFAARAALEAGLPVVALARVGGKTAKLSPGDGWEFEAIYPGARYNRLVLSYSAGTMSVTGMAPNYPDRTYQGNLDTIKQKMEEDWLLGVSPVRPVRTGEQLATFTAPLSGGEDGSLTDSAISTFLEDCNIPPEITHVVFLSELTSGAVAAVSDHLDIKGVQPRMFLFQAPAQGEDDVATYVGNVAAQIPLRSNLIGMVAGSAEESLGSRTYSRHAVEAAALGFALGRGFNMTNTPVPARSFDPVYTEAELDLLKANGIMALMRYIENDVSVYEGAVCSVQNTFLYSSKAAEVMAVVHAYCAQFLGALLRPGPHSDIAEALARELSSVRYLTIDSVQVDVVHDTMRVAIEGILPGEILKISFSIKNR